MIAVVLVCVGCDDQQVNNGDPPDTPKTEKTDTIEPKDNPDEKDPKLPPAPPKHKTDGQNDKTESRHLKEMKIKVYYPDESGLRQ